MPRGARRGTFVSFYLFSLVFLLSCHIVFICFPGAVKYPRPFFLCGGASSRGARTGRSRSGSAGRPGLSPPQFSRSGRRESCAGRARLPARPVLRRSLSGALFSGISPRSTAGCTGRRESASRTPGRPLPASRRARRLRGTQKRQPKRSCLFSMAKARTNARGMTFYMGGIFSFIMPPHQNSRRAHRCGSLCAEGLEAHGVTSFLPFVHAAKFFQLQSAFILPGFPGRRNIHPRKF